MKFEIRKLASALHLDRSERKADKAERAAWSIPPAPGPVDQIAAKLKAKLGGKRPRGKRPIVHFPIDGTSQNAQLTQSPIEALRDAVQAREGTKIIRLLNRSDHPDVEDLLEEGVPRRVITQSPAGKKALWLHDQLDAAARDPERIGEIVSLINRGASPRSALKRGIPETIVEQSWYGRIHLEIVRARQLFDARHPALRSGTSNIPDTEPEPERTNSPPLPPPPSTPPVTERVPEWHRDYVKYVEWAEKPVVPERPISTISERSERSDEDDALSIAELPGYLNTLRRDSAVSTRPVSPIDDRSFEVREADRLADDLQSLLDNLQPVPDATSSTAPSLVRDDGMSSRSFVPAPLFGSSPLSDFDGDADTEPTSAVTSLSPTSSLEEQEVRVNDNLPATPSASAAALPADEPPPVPSKSPDRPTQPYTSRDASTNTPRVFTTPASLAAYPGKRSTSI